MNKLTAAIVGAATAAAVLAGTPAALADSTKTTREKVCVKVRRDGELAHRYVLIRHVTTTYDDAGQQVGQPEATSWHRVPHRFYPHRWERLCGQAHG